MALNNNWQTQCFPFPPPPLLRECHNEYNVGLNRMYTAKQPVFLRIQVHSSSQAKGLERDWETDFEKKQKTTFCSLD